MERVKRKKLVYNASLLLSGLVLVFCYSCSGGKNISSMGQSKQSDAGNRKKKNVSSDSSLTANVKKIFSDNCASCHKPDGNGGDLKDILNLESLIDREYVIPGSKKSKVLTEMKSGKMPPSGSISSENISTVEKWIINGAVIDVGDEEQKRDFVRETDVYRIAAEDLLGTVDEGDRTNIRYLSATHLYNSGTSLETIVTAGEAISKVVNSLSSKKKIAPIKVVDKDKGIFRIDLSDYGWDADTWNKLVRIYPYLIVPKDNKGLAILQNDTKADVPLIRADWFVSTAIRAPTYYDLIGFPDTLAAFETKFNVNSAKAINDGDVARAGFNNSAVSKQNRVIERKEGANGAFWRSYEFGTSEGSQNILEKPLGPVSTKSPFTFVEDGGEFIVTLPNGMLAFYLAGKDKKRLSKVPTDPDEDEIIAGLTCMSCHAKGFIYRKDMVVEAAKNSTALSSVLANVEKLYKPDDEFKELVEDDAKGYRDALTEAGVDLEKKDPVNRIAQGYPLAIPFAQVAAEVGVEESVLKDALENQDELDEVNARVVDGALMRSDLQEYFKTIVKAVRSKI